MNKEEYTKLRNDKFDEIVKKKKIKKDTLEIEDLERDILTSKDLKKLDKWQP